MNEIIINFVTSNPKKVNSLQRRMDKLGLDKYGVRIEVKLFNMEMIEPQVETVKEVSLYKAQQAYKELGVPVVVEDGGLSIDALNGHPGVYSKAYIDNPKLGCDAILRLMNGVEDRSARFVSCVTFVDGNGAFHTFESENSNRGHIMDYRPENACNQNLRSIFWVDHLGKQFIDCSKEETIAWDSLPGKEYAMILFAEWFSKQYR